MKIPALGHISILPLGCLVASLSCGECFAIPSQGCSEESLQRGITYTQGFSTPEYGAGVAFVDLDADDDPDVVAVGNASGVIGIFENDGTGHFVNHSFALPAADAITAGIASADYDRDGLLDLYISCQGGYHSLLLHNDGDFVFSDVTTLAQMEFTPYDSGAAWTDFDLDGWLDLYVPARLYRNRFYHNMGNGTFQEIGQALGIEADLDPTLQSGFFDYDLDGDGDLFLATDKGTHCETTGFHNRMYENIGGLFQEVTEQTGTGVCMDAMNIAVGDYDENGWPDVYSTNLPAGNVLLLQNPDNTFYNAAAEAGVIVHSSGWGALFFDYDNDGHLELYVCNQYIDNILFWHGGDFYAGDIAEQVNANISGVSYTVAAGDVDMDGDVDLLVGNRGQHVQLLINNQPANGGNAWLKVKVTELNTSQYAIGAVIRVRTGEHWQMREVMAGSNYLAQNELIQHFGLGTAEVVDEVKVTWPGGETRTLTNVPAMQTIVIAPPNLPGDAYEDGVVDLTDFALFDLCLQGPGAQNQVPLCEPLDMDGNRSIDLKDFVAFQRWFGSSNQ